MSAAGSDNSSAACWLALSDWCALVPSPRVALLEGIGHYPQVEAPAAVLDAFLEFHEALGRA